METHVIPSDYSNAFQLDDGIWFVKVYFPTKALTDEWLKQRKTADEVAVELEDYIE